MASAPTTVPGRRREGDLCQPLAAAQNTQAAEIHFLAIAAQNTPTAEVHFLATAAQNTQGAQVHYLTAAAQNTPAAQIHYLAAAVLNTTPAAALTQRLDGCNFVLLGNIAAFKAYTLAMSQSPWFEKTHTK